MKISFVTGLASVIALLAFPGVAAAQNETVSTSLLLEELNLNTSLARETETALKANISRKNELAQELQALNSDHSAYLEHKAAYDSNLASHNAAVDSFNVECSSGSFTQAELDRCESQEQNLKAAQESLNARLEALETERLALNQRKNDYNTRAREQAQAAEQLLTRYDEYNANIGTIMADLENREEVRDSGCANRPSPEATGQCLRLYLQNR